MPANLLWAVGPTITGTMTLSISARDMNLRPSGDVSSTGIEPVTSVIWTERSNRLSYEDKKFVELVIRRSLVRLGMAHLSHLLWPGETSAL